MPIKEKCPKYTNSEHTNHTNITNPASFALHLPYHTVRDLSDSMAHTVYNTVHSQFLNNSPQNPNHCLSGLRKIQYLKYDRVNCQSGVPST